MPDKISVIMPTLNEADHIVSTLKTVVNQEDVQIIIVDGKSSDDTLDLVHSSGCKVLSSASGRAGQMNLGAKAADGDILLFLHADTLLPEGFAPIVRRLSNQPGVVACAFPLGLDNPHPLFRLIEKAANLRSKYLQLPYGDQAIFLKAEIFHKIGGFPDIPIMEDVALVRTLNKYGRIAIAPVPVITSARRWEKHGIIKTTVLNQAALASFFLGISPAVIANRHKKV